MSLNLLALQLRLASLGPPSSHADCSKQEGSHQVPREGRTLSPATLLRISEAASLPSTALLGNGRLVIQVATGDTSGHAWLWSFLLDDSRSTLCLLPPPPRRILTPVCSWRIHCMLA